MYGFTRKPRWILMHALVLVVVSLFAVAGFWQLSRLADRRASNQRIEDALAQDPVDLDQMVAVGGDRPRRARATGRYDARRELLVPGRSFEGTGGSHVLTPLVLPSGVAVLVDRGWVPADINEVPVQPAAPPSGRVRVRGVLMPPEPKRPLSPDNPSTGTLKTLRRIDPVRLREQLPYDVITMYLLLEEQRPAPDELPRYAPLPERTEGSHLAYAVQWFAFIVIALVVYGAILRREARKGDAQYPTTGGGGEPSPSKTPAS
jgi:surfeit locus 1 family protein